MFDQDRVVGVEVDLLHGGQIRLVAVSGELNAGCEAGAQVAHKFQRSAMMAIAGEPRNDQLSIGVDAGPRPHVAGAVRRSLGAADVAGLAVSEAPDFVTLDTLGGDVAD